MNPIAEPLEVVIVNAAENLRAYHYLNGKFQALPSRKSLKKAIKARRLVKLSDGALLEELSLLYLGDHIALMPPPARQLWNEKITVVYEDCHIAVVEKVAGLRVSGNGHRTLANALPHNLFKSFCKDAMPLPQPVHRLDKATRGLVICAKTFSAATCISKAFAERQVTKTYRAKVHGKIDRELFIDAPLNGKTAETTVLPVRIIEGRDGKLQSEVLLYPTQGRTHQLRLHLQMVNHPIVGDRLYGGNLTPRGSALQLTAEAITFKHPSYKNKITIRY